MSGPLLWNRIPTAVWAYGLLRALAFAAPLLTEGGTVGLGVVVVLPLYLLLVRRSRTAWAVLVVLDVVGLVLLLLTIGGLSEAPLSVPILSGLALAALLWPSTRRHVTAEPPGSA